MVAILQPFIPDYREEFFKGVGNSVDTDIYVYEKKETTAKSSFKISGLEVKVLKSFTLKGVLFYALWPFLSKKYTHLVLMLHFGHFTTWILLFTKIFHRKKIVIWGQGISVKRYLKEEKTPSLLLTLMIRLADVVWVYTEKERGPWIQKYPNLNIIALNNTISDVDKLLTTNIGIDKSPLKEKFNIKQEICIIFCARFNNVYRRTDLLEKLIETMDADKFGFIIIGDGPSKPDFSRYKNVHDFGAVYDRQLKDNLFAIADVYFQPGWVGLSIVEAMAYGKPIFTFQRSEEILQCVEYAYIKSTYNGQIFKNFEELKATLVAIKLKEVVEMGLNSRAFIKENLMMSAMISKALETLR